MSSLHNQFTKVNGELVINYSGQNSGKLVNNQYITSMHAYLCDHCLLCWRLDCIKRYSVWLLMCVIYRTAIHQTYCKHKILTSLNSSLLPSESSPILRLSLYPNIFGSDHSGYSIFVCNCFKFTWGQTTYQWTLPTKYSTNYFFILNIRLVKYNPLLIWYILIHYWCN